MNIQSESANTTGFAPVFFKSLIEIVDPTRNNVNTNNRLDIKTITLVMVIGSKW